MKNISRWIMGWLIAVMITVVLAVVLQTQIVIAMLPETSPAVGIHERLSMTGYDLRHLGTLYGLFITLALLIAFLVGEIVSRFVAVKLRWIVMVVAGAVAMIVMLFAMKQVFFGVDILAGARTALGHGLQAVSGAIGGYGFAQLTRRRRRSRYAVD